MHDYIIDLLKPLMPKKIESKKIRNDSDFLILRERNKKILILNPTAREIYEICDGRTVGQIINAMSSVYPSIDRKKISVDVIRCLRDMERRELLLMR
ncbi:MAG: PqqD family protein [Candidatus Aenigmatarchaeota archaeon]